MSHPTHMQRFDVPGKTMVDSDSHTPAAGSLGMMAIGVGGTEVALAIAGEPLYLRMPEIWGPRAPSCTPKGGGAGTQGADRRRDARRQSPPRQPRERSDYLS